MSTGRGTDGGASFWSTVPGILTGLAALIGAVVAAVALFTGGEGDQPSGANSVASVPAVIDLSEDTARGLIRGRGMDVSAVRRICSDEPSGRVLRQQPRAGARVDAASSVSLVVSSGQRPGEITFPPEGARLPDAYTVRGTLCGLSAEQHVWLAVRTDGLYPDAELLAGREGRFAQRETFPTPSAAEGGFAQVLLLVGPAGDRAIRDWIAGDASSSALPTVPGQRVVDAVTGLTLKSVG